MGKEPLTFQTQSAATATAAFEIATAAGYAAAMTAFSVAQPSPWANQTWATVNAETLTA